MKTKQKQESSLIEEIVKEKINFLIFPNKFFKDKNYLKNLIAFLGLFIFFNLIEFIAKYKTSDISNIIINNFILLPLFLIVVYGFFAIFHRAFLNKFEIKNSVVSFFNIALFYMSILSLIINFTNLLLNRIVNIIFLIYVSYHFINSTKEIFNSKISQAIAVMILYVILILILAVLALLYLLQGQL